MAFAPGSAFGQAASVDATTSCFFNQHKIDHRFCNAFGYGAAPDGSEVAAINVRTLADVEPWAWMATRVDGRSF